MREIAVN